MIDPLSWNLIAKAVLSALGLILLMGCTTAPPGVAGVSIDTKRASKKILDQYDKDHNGGLSRAELASLPPLESRLSWYDTNHDDQISADELAAGLRTIFDPRNGLQSVCCEVTRNGQPLAGANVKFAPLASLEDAIPPATAVSDNQGVAKLGISPEELPANAPTTLPLVRPGLYLVKVTHPSISVPEEYNVSTTLGEEISSYSTAGGPLKIQLKF